MTKNAATIKPNKPRAYLMDARWRKFGSLRATILAASMLSLISCANSGDEPAADIPQARVDHKAAGEAAADPDFPGLKSLCGEPSPQLTAARVGSNPRPARPQPTQELIPATKVFDDLYFVGNAATSAWVIETTDGLILLDAMWSPNDAETFIEGGLLELGLNPEDIKIMVLSHGHGDHTGGARYLYDKYAMKVVMSAADWAFVNDPDNGFDFPGWNDIPEPDVFIEDRTAVTLGETDIEVVLAPGHTMGTLATVFDVNEGDQSYKAVLWGGTGFNFGPNKDQYRAYADSADKMHDEVLASSIEIFLSNHVRRDGSDKKIATLAARSESDPHPFVLGPERTARAFEVFRECALAQIDALEGGE